MYKTIQKLIVLFWCVPAIAQQTSLSCAPSSPIASPGETIQLFAWAAQAGKPVYAWSVSSGEVRPAGANSFSWKFGGDAAGVNSADGELRSGGKVQARCLVEVQVVPKQTVADDAGLLTPNGAELEGAGLYSYLLISVTANEPLIGSALRTWLALNAPVAGLRSVLKPNEPIALALPVLEKASAAVDPEWVLRHYDFPRARMWLDKVFPGNKPGIYIVSSLQPLEKGRPPYLVQNLSEASPALAAQWVEAFINEAAQEHSWNAASVAGLVDQLRATLSALDGNLQLPVIMKLIALM